MASGKNKRSAIRELSLKQLDNAGQLNIKLLADAGFYRHFNSVTKAQYIKCYACNCCIRDIQPEDMENIWSLHAQYVHYPDCTHVLNRKGLDFIQANHDGKWGEMVGYNRETVRNQCWEEKPPPILILDGVVSKIDVRILRTLQSRSVERNSLPLEVGNAVDAHNEMADENKRLETMDDVIYTEHAKSGFFRENIGDMGSSIRLRCFSCNARWVAPDGENPWTQHVLLNDACRYMLLRKGTDFVQQTYRQNRKRHRHISK